ncbi:hypothetical protein GCM10007977_086140 [Dactylosporangium sucinum]|uniref:Uncharacterized protein n=1 Tax=Dactylosporangium sucinum TaxID=1424081 RepID=A0A917X5M7_9ACTN|nr:hypothetical protein GCM10007977_086140 [Dactylosporangium sucinum]
MGRAAATRKRAARYPGCGNLTSDQDRTRHATTGTTPNPTASLGRAAGSIRGAQDAQSGRCGGRTSKNAVKKPQDFPKRQYLLPGMPSAAGGPLGRHGALSG